MPKEPLNHKKATVLVPAKWGDPDETVESIRDYTTGFLSGDFEQLVEGVSNMPGDAGLDADIWWGKAQRIK